jgi:hypothetical protein
MLAIEMKLITSTGTHLLNGISQWHVSNWNQAQNLSWHSLPGWNFTVACQQLKSSTDYQLALTSWMEFHSGMSAIEIKHRPSAGTHKLDGISQWHVSNWNQAQNISWHSHAEWDFTVACQWLKSSSDHQLALTVWMRFHSGMSEIEIKHRTSASTHSLDEISQWHVSNWNQAQTISWHSLAGWDFTVACQQLKSRHHLALTNWMGFHSGSVSN